MPRITQSSAAVSLPSPSLLSPFLFTIRERLPRRSPKIEIRSPLISSLSASDALHSGYSRRKCALMYFHGHSCNFLARTRTGFKARRANSPHVSPSRRPSVQGRPSGRSLFCRRGAYHTYLINLAPAAPPLLRLLLATAQDLIKKSSLLLRPTDLTRDDGRAAGSAPL